MRAECLAERGVYAAKRYSSPAGGEEKKPASQRLRTFWQPEGRVPFEMPARSGLFLARHIGYKVGVKPRQFMLWLALLFLGGAGSYWWRYQWREHSQDAPILAAARRYGVEPALVKAVVWRESRFDPAACGGKGELGLMQVLPRAAAKDWTEAEHLPPLAQEQLLDPGTNTLVGAWYLGRLLK